MNVTKIWAVRAGSHGEVDHLFINQSQIALRFSGVSDPTGLPASRSAMKDAFKDTNGDCPREEAVPSYAGQLFRFIHEMCIGDHVIYPRRHDRTLRFGEIIGPYVFEKTDVQEYCHRRSVRWVAKAARQEFSQSALYELGSNLTLFEIKSHLDEFSGKFDIGLARPPNCPVDKKNEDQQNVVRDIVETTKDFIAKRLRLEIRGYRMENFIADLFRAMGYRARVTRKVKDDGIDVIAHRDELGIEPPLLKIQVKSSEGTIGPDAVKAFYAMVHDRDVGIFISTGIFSIAAIEFASSRSNLRLMNGIELVELIQKYYDRLSGACRKLIPLRRVFVPDVNVDCE